MPNRLRSNEPPLMRTGFHREPTPAMLALALACVVFLYGTGPPITKLITAPAVPSMALRFWLSAPVLCVLAARSGHALSRPILRRTAVPGVLFGVNLPIVFVALQHTSVAVVAVTMALQPCVVLIVASRWMAEPTSRWHALWTGVGVVGAGIVIAGSSSAVRSDLFGLLAAVLSMLTFSGYYLMNRSARSTTPIDPIQWMAGVTVVASLTVIPIAAVTSHASDFRMLGEADWIYIVFLAMGIGVVAHASMSWIHKYVGASRSSLVLLSMNFVSACAAWPINGEAISPVQVVGGVVVVGAIAAVVSRPASGVAASVPVISTVRSVAKNGRRR